MSGRAVDHRVATGSSAVCMWSARVCVCDCARVSCSEATRDGEECARAGVRPTARLWEKILNTQERTR